MQSKEYSMELGGRTLTATFTDWADQAGGSVLMKYGETVILATAVMSQRPKEGGDYLPLTVDYEEKFYAAGRIFGSRYQKREGRPSDEAILSGRIVDRTIRPLFDQSIRHEIQVVTTVLSIDADNDPDTLGVIGASLALSTSDIPFAGPVSAVRFGIGRDAEGKPDFSKYVINPVYAERDNLTLDLLVCGKDGNVNMIESEAKEVGEDIVGSALEQAVTEIEKIQAWQAGIIKEMAKEKRVIEKKPVTEGMAELFTAEIAPKMDEAMFSGPGKDGIHALEEEWVKLFAEKFPESKPSEAIFYCEDRVNDLLHEEAIKNDRRPDGRKMNELRPISAQAGGISSIVHGVGLFYRGGTHILSVLTLSGPKDSQLIEGMEIQTKKYFMHHYNFPPFSTGETGRIGATSRRSIGHGALAEKSLRAVLPTRETFPYTIRLVSEALASNGSTSMGSVCGSSLALMDGGVPITRPVAGIACGLMSTEGNMNGPYKIITDIQGPEDEHGDMDFKVAGTDQGITGIQLDIKVGGIPVKILKEAMAQSREARLQILEVIKSAIPAPREKLKESAPMIEMIKIDPDKIGKVIGPGGKNIQQITADTATEIDIEDDGSVTITGKQQGVAEAKAIIEGMTHEYKPGERYEGTVVRMMDFGAFVSIGRGKDAEGLVHVSEMAPFRVNKPTDLVKLGDKVPVVVKEVDEKGRLNLSIKGADPKFAESKGLKPAAAPMGGFNGRPFDRAQGKPPFAPRPFTPRSPEGEVGPTPTPVPPQSIDDAINGLTGEMPTAPREASGEVGSDTAHTTPPQI
jgi:polyribonucleotide nucleotidyltransferase